MSKDSGPWGMAGISAVESTTGPAAARDYLVRMLEVRGLRMSGGVGQHLLRSWPTSY